MTNKKWLVLYISTILLIAVAVTVGIIWIQPDNSDVIEKVNNANEVIVIKPVEVIPSNPQDAQDITAFYHKMKTALQENDSDTFNDILLDRKYRSVLFDALSGLCAGYAETPGEAISMPYIENGVLMTTSKVTEPPECELGLSISDFSKTDPVYREALTKDGLLSNLDWSAADYDFLDYHSADIYYQLLWTIDVAGDNAPYDWSVYQLPNDTYVMSNIVGWYDKDQACRIMSGKAIVINKVSGDFKIAAVIDIV